MTIEELTKHWADWGSGMGRVETIIGDQDYALPTLEWVESKFSPFLKQQLSVTGYRVDKWDCNSYALFATAMAKMCHAITRPLDMKGGLLWGFIGYLNMQNGWPWVRHSINFTVVRVDGVRKTVWYEPQLQKVLTLWPEEIASISFRYA